MPQQGEDEGAASGATSLLTSGRGPRVTALLSRSSPGRQPTALDMLGDPEPAEIGEVHGRHHAVQPADEVTPADIGLQEAQREFRDDPPRRQALPAAVEILRLLLGIGSELDDLV